MMRIKRLAMAAVMSGLLWTGTGRGDTLVMNDGRRLEGRVVFKDGSEVEFDLYRFGTYTRTTFSASEVAQIITGPVKESAGQPAAVKPQAAPARAAPALAPGEPQAPPIVQYFGPTYYEIPLRGEVGVTLTADLLGKCLADAAIRKPTVVILEMDSPGGRIDEVSKLIDIINQYKSKLRIVELNRQAISAAAITSLAVDNIYMRRTATIGAATGFQVNPSTGLPQDIAEKFASIWRASGRAAAEVGHHPSVLADAMIDRTFALYKAQQDGKTVITSEQQSGGVEIKPAGRLLAMTAQEAVDCTLAAGIADDVGELGKLLGYPNWVECVGLAVPLTAYQEARIKRVVDSIRVIGKQYTADMAMATANDPGTFRDYVMDPQTSRLTYNSQLKWSDRSDRCLGALARAEADLDRLTPIFTSHPEILNAETIQALRQRIDFARQRVAAQSRQ